VSKIVGVIKRVHFSGKWVEVWFEDYHMGLDGGEGALPYEASFKAGYLMEAVSLAGLDDEVLSNGLQGTELIMEKRGSNYEIDSIRIKKEG